MIHKRPVAPAATRGVGLTCTLLILGLPACAETLSGPELLGVWGGEGIQLVLDSAGGAMEFDCASGTLGAPLIPRGSGAFTIEGTWTRGQGGPAREGEEPVPQATIWSGEIDGREMTLSGRVLQEDLILGPYRLVKDADGLLRRCL